MALLQSNKHIVNAFARKTSEDIPSNYSDFFPVDMKTDSLSPGFGALRTMMEILYSSESKKQLDELLKEISPDVVHAHNIYGRLTTSVLDLLNKKNIPVVMTLHDYKLICPNYKLMYGNRVCEDCKGGKYYNAILNKCHKDSLAASAIYSFESWFNSFFNKYRNNVCLFIAPSQFLRAKFIEFGWSSKQIIYIPNYIVSQDFLPNYVSENYLIYIGRLSGEKGITTLIQAFGKVDEHNIKLKIVGDGPERECLEDMSKKDNRIQFTGYLSGKELSDVTRNARAIVVPSEWYENAPISILEAFAYGKPVVGARIGGIPEMINEGKDGILFESGNVDDLAEKITVFLSYSNSRIVEMGKAAREKAEENYNPVMHYEKLIDVYQKAISMKAHI
ncbi:MAG: glycosyltransferase [Deltaproteobacteria bacterium]|uniref:glycosyltransferase n=1 Tax=Desulfobacula sp. TaxID=2593537 RepID=UPI0019B546B7|nr:glycosyltransferase [Candidatus Desulfobacula maris]MBL6992409.1 glycosyltransferase [Desulfobacula sp.]